MIAFLVSPIGRVLAYGAIILAALGGLYVKGYSDGKSYVQAKWDAAEQATIKRGSEARQDAERDTAIEPDSSLRNDRYNRDKP